MNKKSILLRYKNFVIRALIVVFLTFLATRVIMPTIEAIQDTQARIAVSQEKLSVLTQKEQFLKNVDRGQLVQQARKLNEAIPSVIDLPLALATLQKVSDDTNVELGEFSLSSRAQILTFTPISQGERLSSFQFQVSLAGAFADVQAFIRRMGDVAPLLRVEGIEFESDRSKATINYYFQPRAVAKVPVDTPVTALERSQTQAIVAVSALEPPVLEEPLIATPSATESSESPFR